MKKCLNCNSIFEDDNLNYCANCGEKLMESYNEKYERKNVECPSCGLALSPRFKFCVRCGRNVITGKKAESEQEDTKSIEKNGIIERPKNIINSFILMIFTIAISILFTHLLNTIDVKNVGLNDSALGLSTINLFVNDTLTSNAFFNRFSANILKYLNYFLFGYAGLFFLIALIKSIKNSSTKKIDCSFYLLIIPSSLVILIYLCFEKNVLNLNLLLDTSKTLNDSFPSFNVVLSTVICGSLCAILERVHEKELFLKSKIIIKFVTFLTTILAFIIILLNVFSKAYWITDIIGGLLYGLAILSVYSFLLSFKTIVKK